MDFLFDLPAIQKASQDKKLVKSTIQKIQARALVPSQVPSDLQKVPEVLEAERKNHLRSLVQCGYDVIRNQFFVEEEVKDSPRASSSLSEKTIFNNFGDFYVYLNGNIYKKSSYFQYVFSPAEIEKYRLVISKMNFGPVDKTTYEDALAKTGVDVGQSKAAELKKQICLERTKALTTAQSFKEFKNILKTKAEDFAYRDYPLWKFISLNGKRTFEFGLEYGEKSDSDNYYASGLCYFFDPQVVFDNFVFEGDSMSTAVRHKTNFKRFVQGLHSGALCWQRSGYYDKGIDLYIFKAEIDLGHGINPCVELFFDSFGDFAQYCQGDLSNCDLSSAPIQIQDRSLFRSNEKTKWPVFGCDQLKPHIDSGYDRCLDVFYVYLWQEGPNGLTTPKQHLNFRYFVDFCYFLKGDLRGSNLLFCQGLMNLKDIAGIRFSEPHLSSAFMEKIGISYSKISLIEADYSENKLTQANEGRSNREYELIRGDAGLGQKAIFYVSDLHLGCRVQNASCRCAGDVEIALQAIIDPLVKGIQNRHWDPSRFPSSRIDYNCKDHETLLIGGDTASSPDLFALFLLLLRKSIDGIKIPVDVIFVLGNHELWHSLGFPIDEVFSSYRQLIERYGMHLAQNELLYQTPDYLFHSISKEELFSLPKADLRNRVFASRMVLLGGVGFSGFDDDFNADEGDIYHGSLSRAQEVQETTTFGKLYSKVVDCLPDKRVIIFTHTPKKDWSKDETRCPGFVYVSGHTHRNYFTDDGETRIYADNQLGYHHEKAQCKWFLLDDDFDIFENYDDGIHEISQQQYVDFYHGKNIPITFGRDVNKLYLLKKHGNYCFLHQAPSGNLTILNGGSLKSLERQDMKYVFAHMDEMIIAIKGPLDKFDALLMDVSRVVKKIGGSGRIHGAIVDIDFYNHIYVNPLDKKMTPYYATDIVHKIVYPSLPLLLQEHLPQLVGNFEKLGASDATLLPKAIKSLPCQAYLETNIYKASREIRKMQKLNSNILCIWEENLNFRSLLAASPKALPPKHS